MYRWRFAGALPIATKSGLVIASSFSRIVHGGRGAYVEFLASQLDLTKLRYSDKPHYYYDELFTLDSTKAKVYLQKHRVDYADYIISMYYISPVFLRDFERTGEQYQLKDS